jgi:glycerophosphoryl diester phosphodiesterase
MRYLLASLVLCFSVSTVEAQMIVAHRGASYDAPENTLAAFHEAWKQGADTIEGDFYLTKDGHVVCLHDRTTKRTTSGALDVRPGSVTLAELQKYEYGAWKDPKFKGEKIPLLADVLATIPPGKKIFLEIKDGVEIVEPIQKILAASDLQPEQVVIIAFDQEVVTKCRKLMPQHKASWLTSYKQDEQTKQWRPTLPEVLATLKRTGATGLGTQARDEVVDAEFTQAIRDAGIECHVWTINDAKQAKRYQELGYDSITTDRPGYIREALGLKVAE